MLTLTELKDKMIDNLSEIDVLELLEIDTVDLVERFSDKIEDKYEQILNQLED